MATTSQGSRTALVLAAGLAAGFGLGYSSAPRGVPAPPGTVPNAHEYVGEAKHVNFTGVEPFDVYYPEPYTRPPNWSS